MRDRIVIGTRGSELALWQSRAVERMLTERFPDLAIEMKIIETKGDKVLDTSLSMIGDKGLFTKELETALLSGEIDLAVHSLKDMQTRLPDGLVLGAITERAGAEDALVADPGTHLATLPEGATVATGSLRRRAQLLALRSDLNIVDVRGNVPTRLRRYRENGWDGMILARAGLERLGLAEHIAEIIPPEIMLPAVGQGALGIEIRADDEDVAAIIASIDHAPTRICTTAERSVLRRLEGGCQAPIGVYATLNDDGLLTIDAFVASLDGSTVMRSAIQGPATGCEELGLQLAEDLLATGAGAILGEIRDLDPDAR